MRACLVLRAGRSQRQDRELSSCYAFVTCPRLVDSKPPSVPLDAGARLDRALAAADGEGAVRARVPEAAAAVGPLAVRAHDVLARAPRRDARRAVLELEDELGRVRLRRGVGRGHLVAQVGDRAQGEGLRRRRAGLEAREDEGVRCRGWEEREG